MQLGLNKQLQPHEIKSYKHKIQNCLSDCVYVCYLTRDKPKLIEATVRVMSWSHLVLVWFSVQKVKVQGRGARKWVGLGCSLSLCECLSSWCRLQCIRHSIYADIQPTHVLFYTSQKSKFSSSCWHSVQTTLHDASCPYVAAFCRPCVWNCAFYFDKKYALTAFCP